MSCFILPKILEGRDLQKELKKLKIKLSDIKKLYYANAKTLICLKKRVKTRIDKKLFASKKEEEEIKYIDEFVKKYSLLIDEERRAEIEATIGELKSISGVEREIFGRAILNLRGKREPSRLNLYFVKFSRSKIIDTEMSSGDIVLVSRGEPLKSDLTGTVSEVKRNYITVAFEQKPPKWVFGGGIRIDLYINDVTFKRMEENLFFLRHATGVKRRVRNLALGLEEPRVIEKVDFLLQTKLNETQKASVSKALGSELFLIHGPPGTGKTSTLIELILQEVKKGNRVLATADSNTAVDNILQRVAAFEDISLVRIGHPARILYELEEFSIHAQYEKSLQAQAIKKGWEEVGLLVKQRDLHAKPTDARSRGMSYERIKTLAARGKTQRGVSVATMQSMAKWIKLNQKVDALVKSLKSQEEALYKEIIQKADVVLSTNGMIMSDLLREEQFDVAVIDEGSQQMIPSTLIPIMHAKRFVIAGDHKQLPPTVVSNHEELKRSLFEELIERFPNHSSMLRVQYRMNEKIMGFSNRYFYGEKLIAAEHVKNQTIKALDLKEPRKFMDILDETPVVFVDTKGLEAVERLGEKSASYENEKEAEIVKVLVDELLEMGAKEEFIGLITPYAAQVKLIKKQFEEPLLEIKSVDGFQGREKEIIIISFVRSNEEGKIGFLKDLRRLNVAITRAKRKLICIGDSATLSKDKTYKDFLNYIEENGKIVASIVIP